MGCAVQSRTQEIIHRRIDHNEPLLRHLFFQDDTCQENARRAGVAEEQLGQLEADVTGGAHHGALHARPPLQTINSRMRSAIRWQTLRLGVITKMVSSPATVPTTSLHRWRSSTAATGWALPGPVFNTNNCWA